MAKKGRMTAAAAAASIAVVTYLITCCLDDSLEALARREDFLHKKDRRINNVQNSKTVRKDK